MFIWIFRETIQIIRFHKINYYMCFLSLFISIILCVEIIFFQSLTYVNLFYWIDSEFLNIYWLFMFDSLTLIMCFTDEMNEGGGNIFASFFYTHH